MEIEKTNKYIAEKIVEEEKHILEMHSLAGLIKKEEKSGKNLGENLDLSTEILTCLALRKRSLATEKIVRHILSSEKIYTIRDDEHDEMWIYKDGIFVSGAKTFIKETCRRLIGEAFTSHIINDVINKIQADSYIDSREFFKVNSLEEIAVKNGILNIFTHNLNPFSKNKIFFNKLPITFDPSKTCPNIIKHFENVLKNKDDIPIIVELFGFLLFKEYRIEKAFMFNGYGRNGKSKTLELIKRFLGMENCANIPLQQLDNDIFAISELLNKMANLSGDLSRKALENTGSFKTATGRDLISAPRKFLPRVHFTNYAKFVFCSNELPITYDLTPAFWNRWVLLEFPYTFLSQKEYDSLKKEEVNDFRVADPEIINKISTDDELSGLLNLALEGLERLLKQGDFSYSKTVEEVKKMWIRKSDSFMAFLMDCIEEEWNSKISKSKLKKAYSNYCKINKIKMLGDKYIKEALTHNFAVSEDRVVFEGKYLNIWDGIKFSNSIGSIGSIHFKGSIEDGNLAIDGKNAAKGATYAIKEEQTLLESSHPIFLDFKEKTLDFNSCPQNTKFSAPKEKTEDLSFCKNKSFEFFHCFVCGLDIKGDEWDYNHSRCQNCQKNMEMN